ncbi:uncharacterized protein At4g28440-like [Impatiens glandulifera]|uniref:uncharacterized protein At4g28440-like n=1 Tax=Impatiens glandulifera TaxID=253017 RepID=UPI001FB18804|nr:uncharacterized protein At4g28440-like [Impatiens glandulifera]
MADQKKKQPLFVKVDQLLPQAEGFSITVKVVNSKVIVPRGRGDGNAPRQSRMAECLVGDETGMIIFTARNDQVDLMKAGETVILRNAKVDMFKSSMRLAVDRSGRVEATDAADFTVKEDSNLSLIEFERIDMML